MDQINNFAVETFWLHILIAMAQKKFRLLVACLLNQTRIARLKSRSFTSELASGPGFK